MIRKLKPHVVRFKARITSLLYLTYLYSAQWHLYLASITEPTTNVASDKCCLCCHTSLVVSASADILLGGTFHCCHTVWRRLLPLSPRCSLHRPLLQHCLEAPALFPLCQIASTATEVSTFYYQPLPTCNVVNNQLAHLNPFERSTKTILAI